MKTEWKYISDIDADALEHQNVLLFLNETEQPCIFIRNSKEKTISRGGCTDNLEYKLNSVFYKDGRPYYFHRITCCNSDECSKEQFLTAYEYLLRSVNEPKSDREIEWLLNSLEELFKITPEKDSIKIQTGVYGELLFILLATEHGAKDILQKYHRDFFSKHDLELDQNNRIEVKSKIGQERIHHFSHDQIFRTDVQVFVVSVLLEKSAEGTSLSELFDMVFSLTDDPKILLFLSGLKYLCGLSKDKPGISFSLEKAKQDLRFFNAKTLPHLEKVDVNGVTGVSYDVDCSLAEAIDDNEFYKFLAQFPAVSAD